MIPTTPATRRRFLEASAGAAIAAWLAPGSTERLLGLVPFVGEGPFPLETTIGAGLGKRRALDLSTLTPRSLLISWERFFVRTGCPDRLPPTDRWHLRVHGLVERPVEVEIEALNREAAPMGTHLIECAGNSRAAHFGFMSAARWGGVPLERVLARVGRLPRATRVLASGFDEHEVQDPGSVPGASWIFGLDQIRESRAFLATTMNGTPLTPDHGYPLRLVARAGETYRAGAAGGRPGAGDPADAVGRRAPGGSPRGYRAAARRPDRRDFCALGGGAGGSCRKSEGHSQSGRLGATGCAIGES